MALSISARKPWRPDLTRFAGHQYTFGVTNLTVDLSTFSGEVDAHLPLDGGQSPLGPGIRLARPTHVRVRLRGDREHVEADIAAELPLVAACDRCLDEVAFALPVAYSEEWELGADAADVEMIDDGPVVRRHLTESRVDLADGFWQNAALELPAKILCAEGCRGLCPTCGANRNRKACTCPGPEPDARLAALANWRPSAERPDANPR